MPPPPSLTSSRYAVPRKPPDPLLLPYGLHLFRSIRRGKRPPTRARQSNNGSPLRQHPLAMTVANSSTAPMDAPPQLRPVPVVARQTTSHTQKSILQGTLSVALAAGTDISRNSASRRSPRSLSDLPNSTIRGRRGITAPRATLSELRSLTTFPELWKIKPAA